MEATHRLERKALVLSDSDLLIRAIESSLVDAWHVTGLLADPQVWGREARSGNGDFDLIVVAMSSPSSEPVVALARASLTEYIGRVPILIVSDRPFDSAPDTKIIHLDFPFDVDRLRDKVEEIVPQAGYEA